MRITKVFVMFVFQAYVLLFVFISISSAQYNSDFTNSLGMEFVYINPGTFMMGSPVTEKGRKFDETQHKVVLTNGFYMQTTEVTQGQWRRIMGNNPSYFENCGENCPVENISVLDMLEFIRKLNTIEGTNRYRLPTEAEWEYAARAGTTTAFSFGDTLSSEQANFLPPGTEHEKCLEKKDVCVTMPVRSFSPNAWGLYDMHGNVSEAVSDAYETNYSPGPVTDPIGPKKHDLQYVFRGGHCVSVASDCRSASRGFNDYNSRGRLCGFRLAASVQSEE
jgi:formylglycine-generating enzyme required for sulfatase activity